jgi:hypothetical protein
MEIAMMRDHHERMQERGKFVKARDGSSTGAGVESRQGGFGAVNLFEEREVREQG